MIRLIAFDLDGVLAESRELHYVALNMALEEINPVYVISREEHLSTYDGLPTSKKLQMLTNTKGLAVSLHNKIWESKQEKTRGAIYRTIEENDKLSIILMDLRDKYKVKLACCSNSIRSNIIATLDALGILGHFDYIVSNEDVKFPKPQSEMYLRAMIACGVNPKETLIVEDSHIGRTAAINSGAHLCAVINPIDVTYEKISEHIDMINSYAQTAPKWQGGKMNVLIPMAGAGSRFEKAGYTFPKPLIEVEGKPMIQLVTDNLNIHARHIYIVQKEHYEKYNLKQLLNLITPGCEIVQVEGITEGAACTTLLAKQFIDNDEPLIIANSDQYIEWNSNEFMYSMTADAVDGGILTFKATHPKWSFVRLDEDGFVAEVAEKNPISDIATVGVYYWRKGSDYVKYAEEMIMYNIRTNNEFYVAPVFNQAMMDEKKIKIFPIQKMWGIGTPEDLEVFLNRDK
jgi:HAD superfamily hydrolase (TIGR01509 family)